ncbi:MAG TPA: sigma factor-like helix-turn-helix DNA-binding protein [Planctomycetota bacterium]|nr:sigma factor-like helix-turn-helix DNA-binding protein [Planctomycetota bacterium]
MEGDNEDGRTNDQLGRALIEQRDPQAYLALLARYQDRPFWFARNGCPEEVEAVLWRWFERGVRSYDPVPPLEPFLIVAIRREYRSRRRRRVPRMQRIHELGAELEPFEPRDVAYEICDQETATRLSSAIDELPQAERAAVLAVFVDRLTYRAAAAKLSCSLGTLQRTVGRALGRVAVSLEAAKPDHASPTPARAATPAA